MSHRIPIRPGINENTLKQAQIHYCDYPEKDSICIPYRDADDHLTGFKRYRLPAPRANGQKYHQDAGTGVFGYYTPGGVLVLPPQNHFQLPPNSMILIEGEFKALSLYEAAVPVLGLPSFIVYQRDPSGTPVLLADIKTAIQKWQIQNIYFLGDADTTTNFEFSRQAAFLSDVLAGKLTVFLPRLRLYGPKGIDDIRERDRASFDSFFTALIKQAIRLEDKISPIALAKILLEQHEHDFGSLSPAEKDRHSKRLIKLCAAARSCELSPTTSELIEYVAKILQLGKRQIAELIKQQIRQNQTQGSSTSIPKKYPPEFDTAIAKDGPPAAFHQNANGDLTGVELLEPFWARFYVELNDIIAIQETGQFRQYNPNTGIWELLAPSSLEEELSALIRKYAAYVPALAPLDYQRFHRKLENLRGQVRAKVTRADPFQKQRSFIHLKNTMLVWNEQTQVFDQTGFNPSFYSTGRIDVDYIPGAKCPRFLRFVLSSLSNDDVRLLQRWFGLVVLGSNFIKKMLLAVGLQDRGKSQIATIAKNLAGNGKFSLLRTRVLEERFELGAYRDSNLLYAADVDSRFLMHQAVVVLKSLVGGDPLTAEIKFGLTPVEIRGVFNVLLTTNDRLRIRVGSNPESWRNRLWMIDFIDRYPFKMIPEIGEKLWRDEGPGIVAWAVQGATFVLQDLQSDGYVTLTSEQSARIDKLIAESISVREFVRRCIIRDPKQDLTVGELFENYELWCDKEAIIPVMERTFQEEVRVILEEELKTKRSNSIQRWMNYTDKNGYSKTVCTSLRGYSQIFLSPDWLAVR